MLRAAGLSERFDVVVDGAVAAAQHLPGKPRPDTYLHAAARLEVAAADCVVVEDAAVRGRRRSRRVTSGSCSASTVGQARRACWRIGADAVVSDLAELAGA